jgi:spore coat protein U-like protein
MAAAVAAAMGLVALSTTATAATSPVTATFQVLMKINKACTVTAGATSNIQLGAVGGVDATAAVGTTGSNTFTVNCSNTTAYNIALQSSNNASTAGVGTLKGAIGGNTDTLTYQLCSDSLSCATPWGNNGVSSVATGNGKAGTGNGAAQTLTVYAKVTGAAPALVTPDSYSDTVTVSVYF